MCSAPHLEAGPPKTPQPTSRGHAQLHPAAHLSTTLPDLTLSMTMTGLLRWLADVSAIPSVAPGDLMISTSSGPEALATVSEGRTCTERRNHQAKAPAADLSGLFLPMMVTSYSI